MGGKYRQGEGRPIVGADLGGGRAWSAAVAVWRNGRVEALAVAPGIPDLPEQERRDRVPTGTYRKLLNTGALRVADGCECNRRRNLCAPSWKSGGGLIASFQTASGWQNSRITQGHSPTAAGCPMVRSGKRYSLTKEGGGGWASVLRGRVAETPNGVTCGGNGEVR